MKLMRIDILHVSKGGERGGESWFNRGRSVRVSPTFTGKPGTGGFPGVKFMVKNSADLSFWHGRWTVVEF